MMTELTFNLVRLGYLALLWVFVFSAVAVLRRDLTVKGKGVRPPRPGSRKDKEVPGAVPVAAGQGPVAVRQGPVAVGQGPPVPVAMSQVPIQAVNQPVVVVGPPQAAAPEPIVVVGRPTKPTHLAVTAGPLMGSRLPLTNQPILIGRAASNTLVLDDDYASSRHAQIVPGPDGWLVEDLGSTNGTFLDGAPLVGSAPLPLGVPVTIGHSTLELVG